MNHSQRGFVLPLLLIVVIVLIGGSTYLYFHNQSAPGAHEPIQATSTDDTWETYTNSQPGGFNNFSVSLPKRFSRFDAPDGSLMIYSSKDLPLSNPNSITDPEALGIFIGFGGNSAGGQDIAAWCHADLAKIGDISSSTRVSNEHLLTVAGYRAYSLDYVLNDYFSNSGRQVCVEKGGEHFSAVASPLNSNFMPDFDNIVKSLHFTN